MEQESFLRDTLLPLAMYLDMALLGALPLMIFIVSLITGARSLQVASLWYSPWYPLAALNTCGVGAATAPAVYIAVFFVGRQALKTQETKWLTALLTVIVVDAVAAVIGLLYWQGVSITGTPMTNPVLMQTRLVFSIMVIVLNLAVIVPIIRQQERRDRA